MLRWRARRRPGFPITWYQGRERTFDEMNDTSSQLAAGLIEAWQIEPGDRVAILDKNSDDYIELLFALYVLLYMELAYSSASRLPGVRLPDR